MRSYRKKGLFFQDEVKSIDSIHGFLHKITSLSVSSPVVALNTECLQIDLKRGFRARV